MVLVHINLDELTPRELGSERFEKRRDRAAWNAPGCGELHDDGAIAGRSEDGVELGYSAFVAGCLIFMEPRSSRGTLL